MPSFEACHSHRVARPVIDNCMTDLADQYRQAMADLESLQAEFDEYRETSAMIEATLEDESKILRDTVADLESKLEDVTCTYENRVAEARKDIEILDKRLVEAHDELKKKTDTLDKVHRRHVKLENEYEAVVDQIRMKDSMIEDLENRVQDIVEKITIIEIEKQMMSENNELEKQRLRGELTEANDALIVKNIKAKRE